MKIKFLAVVTILLAFLAGCSVSPEKGQETINGTVNDIVEQYKAMLNSQTSQTGIALVYHLTQTQGFDSVAKKTTLPSIKNFSQTPLSLTKQFVADYVISPIKTSDAKDDIDWSNLTLSQIAGTVEWDPQTSYWHFKPGEPSDQLIIKFPADKTGSTNNAVLTVTQLALVDGNPTALALTLEVDGKKLLEINSTATYNSYDEPISANVYVSVEGVKLDYNHTYTEADKHLVMTGSISQGLSTTESINLDIYFDNDDDFLKGEGTLRAFDMKIVASGDLTNANIDYYNDDDQTIVDKLNANSSIEFKTKSGRHIADGEFAVRTETYSNKDEYEDSYSYIDLKIVYKDGSSEWFSDYIDQLSNSLETETENFVNQLDFKYFAK